MDASQLQNKANLKSRIASLYAYLAKRLQIKQVPKLTITNNVTNANEPFGKTGYYDHVNRAIKIYVTNRHPTDILRSFAHEVIHHWQNERGQLYSHNSDSYTQQDPHMRKKEMEAYLLGNIIFRDWQDENRYGSPEQEPFLFTLNENLAITNPTKLKDLIKQFVQKLIADQIIASYNRTLSTSGMTPDDFIEDFAAKMSSELSREIDTINNKGNWENQAGMVS